MKTVGAFVSAVIRRGAGFTQRKPRLTLLLALITFGIVTATHVHRGVSEFCADVLPKRDVVPTAQGRIVRDGGCDFLASAYFPILAVRAANNPYDPRVLEKYLGGARTFVYPPGMALLHAPLAFFSPLVAAVAHQIINCALCPVLIYIAMRICGRRPSLPVALFLGSLVLLSRPARLGLYYGQHALELTFGTFLAVEFARTRPWLSAIGLALASTKPTFGGPVGLLMLCRGDWQAVVAGGILSAIFSLLPLPWLVRNANGITSLFDSYKKSVAIAMEGGAGSNAYDPVLSTLRLVDSPAFFSRLVGEALGPAEQGLVTGIILAVAALALRRLSHRNDPEARLLSACVICVAALMCMYHLIYDAVILLLPLMAFCVGFSSPSIRGRIAVVRNVCVALLLAPFTVSYLTTPRLITFFSTPTSRLAVCQVGGAAMLIVFALLVWLSVRASEESAPSATPR